MAQFREREGESNQDRGRLCEEGVSALPRRPRVIKVIMCRKVRQLAPQIAPVWPVTESGSLYTHVGGGRGGGRAGAAVGHKPQILSRHLSI